MRTFDTNAALEAALALEQSAPGAFRFLPAFMPAGFRCHDCKRAVPFKLEGGTGYARVDAPGGEVLICYPCSSKRERADLIERGKGALYLCGTPSFGMAADGKGLRLTDWPGCLCFPVQAHSKGRHNLAGTRIDVWFTGPDGKPWHGVSYGEMTQLCHVRRLKGGAK